MQIGFSKIGFPKQGALVLGVLEDSKMLAKTQEVDRNSGGMITAAIKNSNFSGKSHQILSVFTPERRIVLYGLGKGENIDELWSEEAGGRIFSSLETSGEKTVTVIFENHSRTKKNIDKRAAHLAYGALLRSYKFDKYKTKDKLGKDTTLKRINVAVEQHPQAKKIFSELVAVADGIFFARDLVSEPPNVLYPDSFAKKLTALRKLGLKVEVLGEKEMSKLGMGALLGVGQGSSRESKLVVMRWNGGKRGEKPIAFVGKGVCFDTGGISLKPASGMEDMKWDMGGAATVSGLMMALIVTILCYSMTLYFIPVSYQAFKELQFKIRHNYTDILLREGTFNAVGKDITVYIRERNLKGGLSGIIINDERNSLESITVMAESGALSVTEKGPQVFMRNGNRQSRNTKTGQVGLLYFDSYTVDLSGLNSMSQRSWKDQN